MTDPEKNILLLKAFFSPKAKPYCLGTSKKDLETTYMWQWIPSGKPQKTHEIDARPIPDFLTDWNAWRKVELKVMKDEPLWSAFMNTYGELSLQCDRYMNSDLSTRAKALISVLPTE